MAIESISRAMGYQAPVQSTQSTDTGKKAVSTDATTGQGTDAYVDPNTLVIRESDNNNAANNQNNQNKQDGSQESAKQATVEETQKAVEQLNKKMSNSEAVFGIHEGTNRVTIKIIDKETKKVIKEYPPEKTLDMIAKVWEIAGLMVDEKR